MKGKKRKWKEMKGKERKWHEMKWNEMEGKEWKDMITTNSKETLGPSSSRCSKRAPSQARREGEVARGQREIYEFYIDITAMSYLGTYVLGIGSWKPHLEHELCCWAHTRSIRKWKEMIGNEGKRNESKWKEVEGNETKWKEMEGNEMKWKELNGK